MQTPHDPVSTIIPYKNSKALLSYYLGLFSIFPVVGLILGIVAIVFGGQGMKFARENPDAKGKAHAGIGIGCGLVGTLMNLFIVVGLILLLLSPRTPPSP